MRNITSAGGIFVRKNDGVNEILLLKRPNDELGLLKGHQEEGETVEQTAIREIKEETGFKNVTIVKKLGELTRKGREGTGEEIIKTIHLFLMTTDNFDSENAEENYAWFEFNDGVSRLRHIEEANLLKAHKDLIFN